MFCNGYEKTDVLEIDFFCNVFLKRKKMKRPKGEMEQDTIPLKKIKPCSAFAIFGGFEKNLVQLLLPFLPISDATSMRLVCKQWKESTDDAKDYWLQKARVLCPWFPIENPFKTCLLFTFNGLMDHQIAPIHLLFYSRVGMHRYLVQNIVSHFIGRPCNGHLSITSAKETGHPAAQNDIFSFILVYTDVNSHYPDNNFEFFCCAGQGILWRHGTRPWTAVRITHLFENYKRWVLSL